MCFFIAVAAPIMFPPVYDTYKDALVATVDFLNQEVHPVFKSDPDSPYIPLID